ncbi:hypothetical protein ABE28_009165 [Peribacillus muralis]|uniref:Uncharacterized protein n=1 Tax=Peribacillus muralis TaxID=264697 RepID=A0A1B3XMV9_9BACI|nr:hypothetical protein [Peribacillus muralis]AOH54520.1 hypothetical protein ABE28_009165 [Peribacillus muralis]
MTSPWLHNNKLQVSLVNAEDNSYLVYYTLVGSVIPVLVEEVETGKKIKFEEVRTEIESTRSERELDNAVRLMIRKLKGSN